MIQFCRLCDKVLCEGDLITVKVKSYYHSLPSVKHWAFSREEIEADSDTLCHEDCSSPKGA